MPQDKHQVITAIRSAFDGVDRDDGVTLHEAEVIDHYGGADERAAARNLDHDRVWAQVHASEIAAHSSALSFLDPKGFRYYIPAYMTWTINNFGKSHSCSSDSTLFHLTHLDVPDKYHASRLALLDEAQRAAIAMFLLYFSAEPLFGEDARESVIRFWHTYLPKGFS